MLERKVILREIGLTPIWQSREAVARTNEISAQPEIDATTTARSMPAAPVIVDPAERASHIASLDWDALQTDIAQCVACKLCKTRTKTVPGVGHRSPEWMVIGEGPGESEDKQGEPFVVTQRKRVYRERRQVSSARQPRSTPRGTRSVRAVS
jgi:uracil-DNA glycosylase